MKILLLIVLVFSLSNLNAQSGKGKYKYTDAKLSDLSKTYSAGEFHFSMGFELNWDIANKMANQNNKPKFCSSTIQ